MIENFDLFEVVLFVLLFDFGVEYVTLGVALAEEVDAADAELLAELGVVPQLDPTLGGAHAVQLELQEVVQVVQFVVQRVVLLFQRHLLLELDEVVQSRPQVQFQVP